MGWKNVKEHYRIEHIVHVRDGAVVIGSPYVPEIIRATPDGKAVWATVLNRRKGEGEELDRYLTGCEPCEVVFLRAGRSLLKLTFDEKGVVNGLE